MKNSKIVFGILAVILAYSCQYDRESKVVQKEEISIPVRAMILEPELVKETKNYYGALKFQKSADIVAQQTGIVTKLNATPGKKVVRGELIAAYPPANHQLQIDQGTIGKEKLQRDLERQSALLDAGAVSKISVEELKTQLEIQKKLVTQLELVGTVRVPFKGIVTQVHTSLGQEVHPGAPLLSIAGTSLVEVDFYVSPAEIGEIQIGAAAHFVQGNEQFTGSITKKAIAIDTRRKGFRVTASFRNDRISFVGNTVDVTVETGSSAKGLWIPIGSFKREAKSYVVFIASNSKALKRTIELAKRNEEQALVKSGLQQGEQLIVSGLDKLENNTSVEIIDLQ